MDISSKFMPTNKQIQVKNKQLCVSNFYHASLLASTEIQYYTTNYRRESGFCIFTIRGLY